MTPPALLKGTLLCLLFTSGSFVCAQETKQKNTSIGHPELSIGVGAGTGSFCLAMRLANKSGFLFVNDYLVKLHSTPVLTIDFQQPFKNNLSVGFAASMQSFRTAYEFPGGQSGKVRLDQGDNYTRFNYAVRFLINLARREAFSSYIGFRTGVTIWTLKTNAADVGYRAGHTPGARPSLQVVYGLRYFFLHGIGAGFELGFGTAPYLAQANIAYRFD